MKAMSEMFELITEYASEHYYDKFGFNNGELADLRDEIIKLQDETSKWDLQTSRKTL